MKSLLLAASFTVASAASAQAGPSFPDGFADAVLYWRRLSGEIVRNPAD